MWILQAQVIFKRTEIREVLPPTGSFCDSRVTQKKDVMIHFVFLTLGSTHISLYGWRPSWQVMTLRTWNLEVVSCRTGWDPLSNPGQSNRTCSAPERYGWADRGQKYESISIQQPQPFNKERFTHSFIHSTGIYLTRVEETGEEHPRFCTAII